jgi:hypothetical protein
MLKKVRHQGTSEVVAAFEGKIGEVLEIMKGEQSLVGNTCMRYIQGREIGMVSNKSHDGIGTDVIAIRQVDVS